MNRILSLVTLLIVGFSSYAQEWEKVPYAYERASLHAPRLYVSKNDILVTGFKRNIQQPMEISMDGGVTWNQIFAGKSLYAVQFGPDGTVYFIPSYNYLNSGNYQQDTLYTSSDGVNWKNMGYKLLETSSDYQYAISGNNTLIFPRNRVNSSSMHHISTDNGDSWTATALTASLIACSYSADTIILSTSSPWPGLNRYSHDGGVTVHDATGISSETRPLILPNGDVYASTAGNQIFKSTDGGKTYSQVTLNSWVTQIRDLKYGSNGKFYIQVSNGIWETSDFINLTAITATLPNWQSFAGMAVSDNYVYAISDTNIYRYSIQGTPTGVVDSKEQTNQLNVYPNPSNGLVHIEIDGETLGNDAKVVIFNTHGKIILSQNLQNTSLDVSHLPKGIYLLKVISGAKTSTGKINIL